MVLLVLSKILAVFFKQVLSDFSQWDFSSFCYEINSFYLGQVFGKNKLLVLNKTLKYIFTDI